MRKKYETFSKNNVDFETYKKLCYELAAQEPDPEYAYEGLDFADKRQELEQLYKEGKSVSSCVWLICF